MLKNKLIPTILLLVMVSLIELPLTIGAEEVAEEHSYKPAQGYVPNAETAIKIAVAVWVPIYGEEEIEQEKPYQAVLKDGVWFVIGSLPQGSKGGVAKAEINKEDGRIIRISQGK